MAVKEGPILMTEAQVKAILDGRMTVTRRVVKIPGMLDPELSIFHEDGGGNWIGWDKDNPGLAEFTKKAYPNGEGFACPFGKTGDLLWVRETFFDHGDMGGAIALPLDAQVEYRATPWDRKAEIKGEGWRPSTCMPRWASRITLEIVSVRVERLQDITPRDCVAEGMMLKRWIAEDKGQGIHFVDHGIAAEGRELTATFKKEWNAINSNRPGWSWESNPLVWAIGFKRLKSAQTNTERDAETSTVLQRSSFPPLT